MRTKIITLFILFLINIGSVQLKAQNNNSSRLLNNYSFKLYQETKTDNENLFISPLSTFYALLMAYEGAENQTKQEFEKVLSINQQDALENFTNEINGFNGKSDDFFKISNAIWVDNSVKIHDEYRKAIERNYLSNFEETDFSDVNATVSKINEWVSKSTHQKINDMLSSQDLNSDTKMLISNAVYFKGEWLNKFPKKNTVSAPFFSSPEDQYQTVFMKMTDKIEYYENNEFQFIAKPYKNSNYSFCIILPKDLFGIKTIEEKLNTDLIKKITDSCYTTSTSLTIPKFTMQSGIRLKNPLEKLGLKSAFTQQADFSGITNDKPIFLDQILHRTWIELDEEKTEAAAATSTTIYIRGISQSKSMNFKADHPFIFFLKNNQTNALIFMGRYVLPANAVKIGTENLTKNIEDRKRESFSIGGQEQKILYVIDKKVYTDFDLRTIKPDNIESMNVIKDKDEIRKYAEGNYNGAIIIKLKKEESKN